MKAPITRETHRFIYVEAGNGSHYCWKLRNEPLGPLEYECPNWLGPDDALTYENAIGNRTPARQEERPDGGNHGNS